MEKADSSSCGDSTKWTKLLPFNEPVELSSPSEEQVASLLWHFKAQHGDDAKPCTPSCATVPRTDCDLLKSPVAYKVAVGGVAGRMRGLPGRPELAAAFEPALPAWLGGPAVPTELPHAEGRMVPASMHSCCQAGVCVTSAYPGAQCAGCRCALRGDQLPAAQGRGGQGRPHPASHPLLRQRKAASFPNMVIR